ncbi:MAG: NUDIX domain-containing protein [Candidatus Aenigmarchaeota archaeon]|nr:NUDIX domain-containing protein [Candidatus Aenigmarchaeota archaeon]
MRDVTLCFLVKEKEILLGLKKRGFGKDKYNGFGGKLKDGESIEEAALRELEEEINIKTGIKDLMKVADLTFTFPEPKRDWNQRVHVFFINDWNGEPKESDEMRPVWTDKQKLPFARMWAGDKYWLPMALDGKMIRGEINFKNNGDAVEKIKLNEVNEW